MPPQEPSGPFCQSCSLPLTKPEDFGTDQAGYRVNDFCRHCYVNGAFTEPQMTMDGMVERCVRVMDTQGHHARTTGPGAPGRRDAASQEMEDARGPDVTAPTWRRTNQLAPN